MWLDNTYIVRVSVIERDTFTLLGPKDSWQDLYGSPKLSTL